MSNVFSIGWRIPCPGLRASSNSLLSAPVTFRPAVSSLCFRELVVRRLYSSSRRFVSPLGLGSSTFPRTSFPLIRPAPSLLARSVKTKGTPAPKRKEPVENGVPISSKPLSAAEINRIFGPNSRVSPALGNRILSVLQGRRINGTLDLNLPSDITRSARPSVLDAGLQWLRKNHPVDEDAAILARIEKEEQEEDEKFRKEAEELGLYKPQSGHYEAERGKGNDAWGKSVLQEYREKNEARLLAEQEKKRQEWLEGEAKDRENITKALKRNTELQKYEEAAVVEARPRADPNERPLLAWIQKHHLRATNNDIDTSNMTNARRILPALGVTLITLALCYVFAETYSPPSHKDRMWKDVPPAAATVISVIGLNLGVFALWRFPPAWRMLNKYFISVPIYPHALSVVGSIFSHQQVRHLATNMLILWFIGTRVHDEIGRGNFIALFMASGVMGSLTSLSAHVLTKQLTVTSLGASGAIAGLVAAWCMLHSDDQLTLWFLPREWQETVSARGSVFLAGIVLFEAISLVTPFRVAALDHWAHLGGYFTGAAWATYWKAKKEAQKKKRRDELSWVGKLFSD